MLDDARMFEVLAADLDRLDAVPADHLDAPVAACPGWTALDVLAHLGVIHRRLAGMLVDGEAFRMLVDQPPAPPADEVMAWRQATSRAALAALRSSDLDGPTETWFGPATVRVWLRRMVHETAIHRWDVEHAIGAAAALDADVGVDSVDELLEIFVPTVDSASWSAVAPAGATVHAHATDADGEWLLRIDGGGISLSREHAKGDVAVRGTASDLALLFWSRRSPTTLEVFGDAALLDRVLAAAQF
jgi:uncharacterized protein (TIGR03083 family)